MRGKSHRRLGQYLVQHYMKDLSKLRHRAFLMGCIQPDRNPATYLKGSLRHQWLRGHNYANASRYMCRIAGRLERKRYWTLLDYYTLGKLIHYTMDAFTYAHNDAFPADLSDHRAYEIALQNYFLSYLDQGPAPENAPPLPIMESIATFHRKYQALPGNIHTDSKFAFQACCCILAALEPTG